jgi:two-component system response regulator VicR
MKILVCDDDEALMSMVRFKLSRELSGEVESVADGRQALQKLREQEYDMVVTDIHMPFHSGLEIVQFLRHEQKRNTPVIVLSAEGLENTVLQAFELGANDFITKPFSPAELVVRVKRLLSK